MQKVTKSRLLKSLAHGLRDFLRQVVVTNLAASRPRDYGCLAGGWSLDPAARSSVYAAWHSPGGRSLTCAVVWTRARLHACDSTISALCPRCMTHDEGLLHRLWDCTANSPLKEWLCFRVGIASPQLEVLIGSLPLSFARTGFCPASFHIASTTMT